MSCLAVTSRRLSIIASETKLLADEIESYEFQTFTFLHLRTRKSNTKPSFFLRGCKPLLPSYLPAIGNIMAVVAVLLMNMDSNQVHIIAPNISSASPRPEMGNNIHEKSKR